jgi:channel protein (hemolysin III family)
MSFVFASPAGDELVTGVALRPMWLAMPGPALAWLAAGGAAYTVGVLFYVADERPFAHFAWHLFVLAGTACHVVALLVARGPIWVLPSRMAPPP